MRLPHARGLRLLVASTPAFMIVHFLVTRRTHLRTAYDNGTTGGKQVQYQLSSASPVGSSRGLIKPWFEEGAQPGGPSINRTASIEVMGLSFITLRDHIQQGEERRDDHYDHHRDHQDNYLPFLLNKACYFHHHRLPYAIVIIGGHATTTASSGEEEEEEEEEEKELLRHPTLLKPSVVQEALRWMPRNHWLFFLDADTLVLHNNWTLGHYLPQRDDQGHNNIDLVLNDHNIAVNNGAFFLRAGPSSMAFVNRWLDLLHGRVPPFRTIWPFTDQGAMLEAILQLDEDNTPSHCSAEHETRYSQCFSEQVAAMAGEFDGRRHRTLYDRVVFSPPAVRGFNNHMCLTDPPQWGWDRMACFDRHTSFILHTKEMDDSMRQPQGGEDGPPPLTCPPALALASKGFLRPGTLLILPLDSEEEGSSCCCYLDEEGCQQRASMYLSHEP